MESWDLEDSLSSSKSGSKLSRKRKVCPPTPLSPGIPASAMTSTQAQQREEENDDEEEEEEVLTKTKRGTKNSEETNENWEERAFRRQLEEAIRRSQLAEERKKKKQEKESKQDASLNVGPHSKEKKKPSKKRAILDDEDEDEDLSFCDKKPEKSVPPKPNQPENSRAKKSKVDVVDNVANSDPPLKETSENFIRIRIQDGKYTSKLMKKNPSSHPTDPTPHPVNENQSELEEIRSNGAPDSTTSSRGDFGHGSGPEISKNPTEGRSSRRNKNTAAVPEPTFKKSVTVSKSSTPRGIKKDVGPKLEPTTPKPTIIMPTVKVDPPRSAGPKWSAPRMIRSPASVLSAPSVSTVSTPHRVGLSRNFKALKPLHSKVKLNVGD